MFWKKIEKVSELLDREKRERLFFHDIINQTHGLLLYLNQKHTQEESLGPAEIKVLETEVRALQSLIRDHFHFKHKNLSATYDWVSFPLAEIAMHSLINTYLPARSVKTVIHLKGDLALNRSEKIRESVQIYFPAFYRIMNNLIKNMAEARSSEVQFDLDYGYAGLLIETQNKFKSEEDLKVLSEKLSSIILDERPSVNGLGLESIHHLALECGGEFEFEIKNDLWINRIFLPLNKEQTFSKKAA